MTAVTNRRLSLAALLAWATWVAFFMSACAPHRTPPVIDLTVTPRGYLTDSVRAVLARAWDDSTPYQTERAFCVRTDGAARADDGALIYLVGAIEPAITTRATPGSVQFRCVSQEAPFGHTHPPVTCDGANRCERGGLLAYACRPSSKDESEMVRMGVPYILIQCSRDATIFVFNPDSRVHEEYARRRRAQQDTTRKLPSEYYAAALYSGLILNLALGINRDAGGYRPRWDQYTGWHALSGGSLAMAAATAGVRPRTAFLLTCAAAIGFEYTQGFADYRDAAASCSGAAVGALWVRLWGQ